MNLLFVDLIEQIIYYSFLPTNGCCKKHRCVAALYILSCLARKHLRSIEFLVGAPGYRNGNVDGLNTVDKRCLKNYNVDQNFKWRKLCYKKINKHLVKKKYNSNAEECARLYRSCGSEGVKMNRKYLACKNIK